MRNRTTIFVLGTAQFVMVPDSPLRNALPGDAPAEEDGEQGVVLADLPAAGEAVA